MGQRIKTFLDGSFLEYAQGAFDGWCVYLTRPNKRRRPPKDTEYFQQMQQYAERYGADRIYRDYVRVYDMTGRQADSRVLSSITDIAETYGSDAQEIDIMFSILYMAMIAEERKENTRLGKRIKRLGIHVLLKENRSVGEAADFMRGMSWRRIDALCRERGF
ncbi:hypothetical protein SAMN05216343_11511 [Oscillibacter sp. PC13]|uniref:DUF7004 family protein n=1 Tax=Oscillibacter sp. PC13 TaxID=1855299 RepID=UPI0008F087A6|nr:hypothetical protein [Oscillibacter sp. PC13]SFP80039.1 hypothetical protein SAMN05216343_11511 [Oscillibacter sp. PC13]